MYIAQCIILYQCKGRTTLYMHIYLDCHEVAKSPVILPATETVVDLPTEAGFGVVLVDQRDMGLSTYIPTTVGIEE